MSIASAGPTSSNPPAGQTLLAVELATFERELPRLLAQGEQDRWVVVRSTDILAICDTFDEALQAGYDRFPQAAFLVQQIKPEPATGRGPWQRTTCPS
jgi:hypothetical protein